MYFSCYNTLFHESMTLYISILDLKCIFCIFCFVFMVGRHIKIPCASINDIKNWIVHLDFVLLWILDRMSQVPKYNKSTKFMALDGSDFDFLP
jgi:hypothetical protein